MSMSDEELWEEGEADALLALQCEAIRDKVKRGWIYFIACDPMGAVKIGFSASRPERRLGELQIGCPARLRLLAAVPALEKEEKRLHEAFRHLRIGGEWFRLADELRHKIIFDLSEVFARSSFVEVFAEELEAA